MKKRDLERVLLSLGWWLLRQGAHHEIWTNGSDTVAVPRHIEINELTARGIIARCRRLAPGGRR